MVLGYQGQDFQDIYVKYLLSEPCRTTCTGLSDILEDLPHDRINRFLLKESHTPQDLFNASKSMLTLTGGVLSVDDTIIDKPYSNIYKTELIGHHWSGKHHRTVKGICVVTLYYTDSYGACAPINYRIYHSSKGQSKNDLFQEMVDEVLQWGLKPAWVTGDCWYSSLENLKFVRKRELGMCFGVEKNRLISLQKGTFNKVEEIPQWDPHGVPVYLKDFGMVKVFRQEFKDGYRYYIIAMPKIEMLVDLSHTLFNYIHSAHWNIERFHRAAKQLCNLETFQVRKSKAIVNHIFFSMLAFIRLESMRMQNKISNWYHLQRNLFQQITRNFIKLSNA